MSSSTVLQEKASPYAGVFSTGLALFSMFFGAGNLIFPLIVGRMTGAEVSFAVGGLGLSAVLFPFLGLMAMMFYGGDLKAFLGRLGARPAFFLLLVLILTQGPVACMPRLVTLMHASLNSFGIGMGLPLFSVGISILVFFLTYSRSRLIELLGVVLTPFLLLTLALLITFGAIDAPIAVSTGVTAMESFSAGLKGGYQTMDLIASILFATVIMPHLAKGDPTPSVLRVRMLLSSLIAALLLMVSYIGLCHLAAHHAGHLPQGLAPQELLHVLAEKVLGPWGAVVASGAVFFACLTTAISLAAISADYIKTEVLREKGHPALGLLITVVLMGTFANLGFEGIVRMTGPVLEVLYPALIVLCLANIAHTLYRVQPVKLPVWVTLGLSVFGFAFS